MTAGEQASPDRLLRLSGNQPVLAVLTGPSGVGKDAVLEELGRQGHEFVRVVTYTTRDIRPGEVPGRDYNYVTNPDFEALLARNALIEHSEVYGKGYYYGVPRDPVVEGLAAGKDVILRIDVQGALKIHALVPAAVLIFLAAPSREIQRQRIITRAIDTADAVERRIAMTDWELDQLPIFDYLIVNEQNRLAEAAERLRAVLVAERQRVNRPPIILP